MTHDWGLTYTFVGLSLSFGICLLHLHNCCEYLYNVRTRMKHYMPKYSLLDNNTSSVNNIPFKPHT